MDDRANQYGSIWGPTLVKGLPRDYLVVLVLVCCIFGFALFFFFRAAVFVALGLAALGWLYGWWRARKDPEFVTIWIRKLKLGNTKDRNGRGNVYFP